MTRTIIHFDLDAFFCAVEEQRDPSLRRVAFAVGGRPGERGVVASCSYAARQFGVRSAMPMTRALALCPGLIVVPGRHSAYRAASAEVMTRVRAVTAQVEQLSIDEAFLDVSNLPSPGFEIAARLQATIRDELGLPCSLGVATNKLVAKIATDVGKSAARGPDAPRAICVVPPGDEAAFLAPLPADALWGVGPKTAARLAELGLRTIGDIAHRPEAELVQLFGQRGYELARHARGLDDREIVTTHETKSVSREATFARDVRDGAVLRETLHEQAARVARDLRQEGLCGATVKLKLRWPDFTTLTRQITLPEPTDDATLIAAQAVRLLEQTWKAGHPVRLIGVGVSSLGVPVRQLTLWDAVAAAQAEEKRKRVEAALEELRVRFGEDVVRRGDVDPRNSDKGE